MFLTFSAFHEMQHELLYLDVLQESLPICVRNSQSRRREIMEWAAKSSELRVVPLTAGSLN